MAVVFRCSFMLHERVLQRIDAIVPSDVTHVGFVLRDFTGAVSVLMPEIPKHGVTATLPRAQRYPGERPSDAVQRCLQEVSWLTYRFRTLAQLKP